MLFNLQPHPESRPEKIRVVTVEVQPHEAGWWFLSYAVEPGDALLLPDYHFARLDRLWTNTCFELFIKIQGGGYREFNFAPAGGWNAYAFRDWRRGMTPLAMTIEPNLVDVRIDDRVPRLPAVYSLDVVLPKEAVERGTKMSLAAVIEEKGGAKSYWALAHPPGPPNFHHAAGFTTTLPLRPHSSPRT